MIEFPLLRKKQRCLLEQSQLGADVKTTKLRLEQTGVKTSPIQFGLEKIFLLLSDLFTVKILISILIKNINSWNILIAIII